MRVHDKKVLGKPGGSGEPCRACHAHQYKLTVGMAHPTKVTVPQHGALRTPFPMGERMGIDGGHDTLPLPEVDKRGDGAL